MTLTLQFTLKKWRKRWPLLTHDFSINFKKKGYCTGDSQAVTHPSTNPACGCLTSEIERDRVHSTEYGRIRHSTISPGFIPISFLKLPAHDVQLYPISGRKLWTDVYKCSTTHTLWHHTNMRNDWESSHDVNSNLLFSICYRPPDGKANQKEVLPASEESQLNTRTQLTSN